MSISEAVILGDCVVGVAEGYPPSDGRRREHISEQVEHIAGQYVADTVRAAQGRAVVVEVQGWRSTGDVFEVRLTLRWPEEAGLGEVVHVDSLASGGRESYYVTTAGGTRKFARRPDGWLRVE